LGRRALAPLAIASVVLLAAVALGARAVMIGRAYLWGLAANGQAGVENVLDILRGGIDSALRGLGKASVRDLTPDEVVVPPGFAHILGVLYRPAAPDRHARQDSARTPRPPRKI
jgi:hypothetical protein